MNEIRTYYEIMKMNHRTGKVTTYQRDNLKEIQNTYSRISRQKLARGTSLRVSKVVVKEIDDIFAEVR